MPTTSVLVRYRVETPSIPGPDLPLMRDKAVADRVAARAAKAGHPSTVQEVLVRR